MLKCDVCGSLEFEKYAGFMYCVECQTQSQDFIEQEHEFKEGTVVKQQRVKNKNKKKENDDIEGVWTSWKVFNLILYGMTCELRKNLSLPINFKILVLKLWAAYLRACDAGFISKHKKIPPKLQLDFKYRDAKVLYGIDFRDYHIVKRPRSKSGSSEFSGSSSFCSSRSMALKKRKIIASDYDAHISESMLSQSSLQDETLESLGKSEASELSYDSKADSEKSDKTYFKEIFGSKDYRIFKKNFKSKKSMVNIKEKTQRTIKSLSKNKLLSMLHLASLMSGSQIHLSDLLRFIREGHLSFAKVTHFLPKDMKFSKNDFSYIDIISDSLMPTHLKQRSLSSRIAYLVGIDKLYSPNMILLVKRYCTELNLPEQICKFSQIIVKKFVPESVTIKRSVLFPSYEAWAMVSIIFVLKLLFGLNDKTEFFLSDLAKKLNRTEKIEEKKFFVFRDWQNFIECRKAVLVEYHFPTHEQLNNEVISSSKKFIYTLLKESKDEYKNERFISYKKYYMDKNLLNSIKDTLGHFTDSHNISIMHFEPSLTPQISHLKSIICTLSHQAENVNEEGHKLNLPEYILNQSFEKSLVNFIYNPKEYIKLKNDESQDSPTEIDQDSVKIDEANILFSEENDESHFLFNCSSTYWIFHDCISRNDSLTDFKKKVLDETPFTFQWLITECARMLEMNIREVYNELVILERYLIKERFINKRVKKRKKRN